MVEKGVDRKTLFAELVRSPHGSLASYLPFGRKAAVDDPEYFAHIVAWNAQFGQVRDAVVALPVIAASERPDAVLLDNALAHIAAMNPRSLAQAVTFGREVGVPSRVMRRLVTRYLRELESDRRTWERVALQHRDVLRSLYAMFHVSPGSVKGSAYDVALMRGAAVTGKFAAVRTLAQLPADQVGEAIARHRIPFLIARGALGARAKKPVVLAALIKTMTDTELVSNMRLLKRLGVEQVPEARAALEQAIESAGTKRKGGRPRASLKATTAAVSLEDSGDVTMAAKLRGLQERQLHNLGGVEGDWLVLVDKSSSMTSAVEAGKQVAALLSRMAKGKVALVFFDTHPQWFDVTGQDYESVKSVTARVRAGGSTSIGCGLDMCVDKGLDVDGVAIVSDGGHNTLPAFSSAMKRFEKAFDRVPTVYFYHLDGDRDSLTSDCQSSGIDVQEFDLRGRAFDYHSLPNLVGTMRTSKYSLIDEVMNVPLLTLDGVLRRTVGMKVLAETHAVVTA